MLTAPTAARGRSGHESDGSDRRAESDARAARPAFSGTRGIPEADGDASTPALALLLAGGGRDCKAMGARVNSLPI